MGPAQAATAARLVGARMNIPVHYGTFPALTGSAEDFERECQRIGVEGEVRAIGAGEEIRVRTE